MVKYSINEAKRTVTCILHDSNRTTVGIAYCSPEDEWDVEIGKKVAFNRARKCELGQNITELKQDLISAQHIYNNYIGCINRRILKAQAELTRLRQSTI